MRYYQIKEQKYKKVHYLAKFIYLMDDRGAVFSLPPVRRHMLLICPITGDVNFDYLIKGMSINFFPL